MTPATLESPAESPERTLERIREAADLVRRRGGLKARIAVILGTGLGELVSHLEVDAEIPYREIPHFPVPTVETHAGRLLVGRIEGVPAYVLQGRFHRYEGYDLRQVTFPVRVLGVLGVDTLVVSAACGGMNPLWAPGDIMVIDDHINLLGENPLTGPNLDELGPRFPDMSEPYDRALQELAVAAAMARGIPLRRGVYVAVQGPNLETRAEYRMLRWMGADVVGMSTVPEVIVARHMDMRVLGLTIVTDRCLPDALEVADVATIIATAEEAQPRLSRIIGDVVARIGAEA